MIRISSSGCGKTNERDVADKVFAAHFSFKISNLRLAMSRRFGIIELFWAARMIDMQNNLSAFKRIFVEQAEFAVHEYF